MDGAVRRKGVISFDCLHDDDEDVNCLEGCYRLPPGEWKVFWFNNDEPMGRARCIVDAGFQSGVIGLVVEYNDRRRLSKAVAKRAMSEILKVSEWEEVRGPDSLQMK